LRIKKVKKSLNKVAKRFGSHYYFPYLYIINKKGIIPQNQKKNKVAKRFGSHYYFPYLYIINKKGIIPQNQKKREK